MASDIESVRAAVVREVGFLPPQVTDILVLNPIAEPNGATLPMLDHPRIILYTEPAEALDLIRLRSVGHGCAVPHSHSRCHIRV